IGKGASAARGEDTKLLKPVVIDWIVPAEEVILPPLPWYSKISCGFNQLLLADYSVLVKWIGMTQSRLLYFYSDINY
ncbi:uncharacterized protein F5891DRAFT_944575, partial [Suillus fuscotomentosus]